MNGYLFELNKHYYFLGSNKTRRNKEDAKRILDFIIEQQNIDTQDNDKKTKSLDMIYNKMQQVKLNYYVNYYGIRTKDCGFTLDIDEVTVINESEVFKYE